MAQESMQYDVVIVGAGPAGLSAAIRYAQLCKSANKPVSVCVLEKGSEVGAHLISGAVLELRALKELLPDYANLDAPLTTPVTHDAFWYLTSKKAIPLIVPFPMKNKGNVIISLSQFGRWLKTQAENLGVEIYPGFAATEVLFDENGTVTGVKTGDMGKNKKGEEKPGFQAGMAILGKHTLLAEGCRGSLSQQLIRHFRLDKDSQPQTYGIGLKEVWEIEPKKFQSGNVVHTVGWPLDTKTYGGSFIYHWGQNLVSIGLVMGLDYQNPYLNPYEEFQRFKHHHAIRPLLEGGNCISYGARALNEGGWQSIPKLTFPGGMLIGDSAGFLNVPKIKGNHTAMKSGMLAAEAVFESQQSQECTLYTQKVKASWIEKELKRVRNIRGGFRGGLFKGLLYAAFDTYVLRGKAPWTFCYRPDYQCTQHAKGFSKIVYPKPDGVISFDKLTSVSRTNVFHEEDQPPHLRIKDQSLPLAVNWAQYAGLEARYCPAGVYEYLEGENGVQFQINAQNCIHCKSCDIKDPSQNIVWVPPEGGGGPQYHNM